MPRPGGHMFNGKLGRIPAVRVMSGRVTVLMLSHAFLVKLLPMLSNNQSCDFGTTQRPSLPYCDTCLDKGSRQKVYTGCTRRCGLERPIRPRWHYSCCGDLRLSELGGLMNHVPPFSEGTRSEHVWSFPWVPSFLLRRLDA